MSRYRVTLSNVALGHLSRVVSAPDASSAIMVVARIVALMPAKGTVWDAAFVNYETVFKVFPLDPLPEEIK